MGWEPTELERQRLEKLEQLVAKGIDPFPRQATRTHTAAEAIAALQAASEDEPPQVTVCGRIRSMRGF